MAITPETQAQLKQAFETLKNLSRAAESGVTEWGSENGVEYIIVGGPENPALEFRLGSDGSIAYPDPDDIGEFVITKEDEEGRATAALAQIQPLIQGVQAAEEVTNSQDIYEIGLEVLREYKFPQTAEDITASSEAYKQLNVIISNAEGSPQDKKKRISELQLPQTDLAIQFYAKIAGEILDLGLDEQSQTDALQNLSDAFSSFLADSNDRGSNAVEDFNNFSIAIQDFLHVESASGRDETQKVVDTLYKELLPKTHAASVGALENNKVAKKTEIENPKETQKEETLKKEQREEEKVKNQTSSASQASNTPTQPNQFNSSQQPNQEGKGDSRIPKKDLYKLGTSALTLAACFIPAFGPVVAIILAATFIMGYDKLEKSGFFEEMGNNNFSTKASTNTASNFSQTTTGQKAGEVAKQTKEELEKQQKKLEDEKGKLNETDKEKRSQQYTKSEALNNMDKALQEKREKEAQEKKEQRAENKQNPFDIWEDISNGPLIPERLFSEKENAQNQGNGTKQSLSSEEERRRKHAKELAEEAKKFVEERGWLKDDTVKMENVGEGQTYHSNAPSAPKDPEQDKGSNHQ